MSDMSESSSDEEDNTSAQITLLLAALSSNPQDYASHSSLITILRTTGDLSRFSLAREAFSTAFPLTEQLWLEWIADTKRFGTPQETIELCKRSVRDYLSIALWKEYCENSIKAVAPEMLADDEDDDVEMTEPWLDLASVKAVLLEAEKATRYHVGSNDVWGLYRDFKVHCLMGGKETVETVREMYLERLAQSHLGMNNLAHV
jgi:hypothetical protein